MGLNKPNIEATIKIQAYNRNNNYTTSKIIKISDLSWAGNNVLIKEWQEFLWLKISQPNMLNKSGKVQYTKR